MIKGVSMVLALLFAGGLSGIGLAAETTGPGSAAQEKKLVAFVGKAVEACQSRIRDAESERRLLAEFSDPKGAWVDGELYLYVYDMQGNCLAHGYRKDLIGRNLLGLQDSDGVFMIREMIQGLKGRDSWWQNFRFPNPVRNNKVAPKRSFNRLVPSALHSGGILVGSGYYLGE